MRLFLLPISTRRTLLYCQKESPALGRKSLMDQMTSRASLMWANWEQKEAGWQKRVVEYGNHMLRRISFEEWGLKSVPPLSTRRRETELRTKQQVQLVYPSRVLATAQATAALQALGIQRQGLHRSRLIWCLVGMPLTAPIGLVPL